MSQQCPKCTGAGSLALAHQQTAVHCYCWCKGHVRVYNCAGMWRLQQIFYRIPLILLPRHNLTVLRSTAASLIAAMCHRTVLACSLETWARVFRFQISERSIAASRHCRAASEHRPAAALQHACILPQCVLSNLFVLQLSPLYSGQMTPSIFTQNIKIQA